MSYDKKIYSDCFLFIYFLKHAWVDSSGREKLTEEKKRFLKTNPPKNFPAGIIFKKIIAFYFYSVKRAIYFTAEFCCGCCCWFDASHELKASLKKLGESKKKTFFGLKKFYLQCSTTHSLEQYSSSHSGLVMAELVQPCRMHDDPNCPPWPATEGGGGSAGGTTLPACNKPEIFFSKMLQVFLIFFFPLPNIFKRQWKQKVENKMRWKKKWWELTTSYETFNYTVRLGF